MTPRETRWRGLSAWCAVEDDAARAVRRRRVMRNGRDRAAAVVRACVVADERMKKINIGGYVSVPTIGALTKPLARAFTKRRDGGADGAHGRDDQTEDKKSRDDGMRVARRDAADEQRVSSSTFSIERASTETRRTARDSFVRFYCSPRSAARTRPGHASGRDALSKLILFGPARRGVETVARSGGWTSDARWERVQGCGKGDGRRTRRALD